jgi:CheY-like chemotaxis protein
MAILNIVLIEDNPSDVFLTNLALEKNGLRFEMVNFQNGADALASLCPAQGTTEAPPIPDVILLDLNTPRSSASLGDRRRATRLGATAYIQKPTQLGIHRWRRQRRQKNRDLKPIGQQR